MRRYNALGDLLGMIGRDMRDHRLGKIHTSLCGYVFSDKGYTNPQGVYFKPTTDQDGKAISLIPRNTVTNCPQPPEGVTAPRTKFGFQVPASKCQKCPFHGRGNFCSELRRLRNRTAADDARDMGEMLNSAVRDANAMLSGKEPQP